jgi:hypothetical protein
MTPKLARLSDSQPRHPPKITLVLGQHRTPMSKRGSCDLQIMRTNQLASRRQI